MRKAAHSIQPQKPDSDQDQFREIRAGPAARVWPLVADREATLFAPTFVLILELFDLGLELLEIQ